MIIGINLPVRVLTRFGSAIPDSDPETSLQGEADAILHKIQDYSEAGVDRIVIEPVSSDLDDFLRKLSRFADEITPHITRASARKKLDAACMRNNLHSDSNCFISHEKKEKAH